MHVLRIPSRLKWILGGFFLMIGFFTLELVYLSHLPFKNPNSIFAALFSLLVFAAELALIHSELKKAFFDPALKWYQGLPQAIPQLRCSLYLANQKSIAAQVAKIDGEGVFVFSLNPQDVACLKLRRNRKNLKASFHYQQQSWEAKALPILKIKRIGGLGLQFVGLSDDSKKKLNDFVETLRSDGYLA